MNRPLSAILLALSLLGAAQGASAQSKVSEYVSQKELGERIDLWRKAREAYYQIWAGQVGSLRIKREASEFLVGEYIGRPTPPDFAKSDKRLIQGAVFADLELVLNRSAFEAFRRIDPAFTPAGFLGRLKELKDVVIEQRDVQGAIRAEECNVIPCPPDKCDPNTCAARSFQRFTRPQPAPAR